MTHRWLIAVALGGLCTAALADEPKHAPMKPGTYEDRAPAWKKLTVRDVSLGARLFDVKGFTCGPDPSLEGYSTYRRTCVKFLDERCKGKPTSIHHIRSSADVPKGQGCFMDESNGATYLDRVIQAPPLSSVWIVGTDTSAPLVYEVHYTFAKDVLTDDSNIGKALVGKYGQPSSRNPPYSMNWQAGQVQLDAGCGTTEGPTGDFCHVTVEDNGLLDSERSIQQVADDDAQKRNAPPAPKL